MQIFFTHRDPYVAAEHLDDKRLIKMVLETAQILSTVSSLWGNKTTYRKTHTYHPCVKWAAHSRDNYLWLFKYFDAISSEYEYRFEKIHASSRLRQELYDAWALQLPFGEFTLPPKVMLPQLQDDCIATSYRNLLNYKWKETNPKWTKRQPPEWRVI